MQVDNSSPGGSGLARYAARTASNSRERTVLHLGLSSKQLVIKSDSEQENSQKNTKQREGRYPDGPCGRSSAYLQVSCQYPSPLVFPVVPGGLQVARLARRPTKERRAERSSRVPSACWTATASRGSRMQSKGCREADNRYGIDVNAVKRDRKAKEE